MRTWSEAQGSLGESFQPRGVGSYWQPPGWACRETLEDGAGGTQPSHYQVRDSSILAASLERGHPVEAVLGLFCSPGPGLCLGTS